MTPQWEVETMGAIDGRDDETTPLTTEWHEPDSGVRPEPPAAPAATRPRAGGRYVPLRPHARGGLGEKL